MSRTLFLIFSLFLRGALGGLICEELPVEMCSFSISSSGKRCLLENHAEKDGSTSYQCETSEVVVVNNMSDWVETEECITACGVDRNSVGISSDSFLDSKFTAKLCSSACYHNCPNIVDLYFNLALGEGTFLPDLCRARRLNSRRAMKEILSSGAAYGPSAGVACAPESSAQVQSYEEYPPEYPPFPAPTPAYN
ncbi:PAR1 [Dillenia turbinata]|uniref:PAR1 n=1 Tax=Dillenia turbinata TaxID=194707 RepID=A0AAN8Z6U5_9MAGN